MSLKMHKILITLLCIITFSAFADEQSLTNKKIINDLNYLVKNELFGSFDLVNSEITKEKNHDVYALIVVKRNTLKLPASLNCNSSNKEQSIFSKTLCKKTGVEIGFNLKLKYFHTRNGYMLHVPVVLRNKVFHAYINENQ